MATKTSQFPSIAYRFFYRKILLLILTVKYLYMTSKLAKEPWKLHQVLQKGPQHLHTKETDKPRPKKSVLTFGETPGLAKYN